MKPIMKKMLSIISIFTAIFVLAACAKNDDRSAPEVETSSPGMEQAVSTEQQALIDSIDTPIMDEKNTDIAPEIANASTDGSTTDQSLATSSVTSSH